LQATITGQNAVKSVADSKSSLLRVLYISFFLLFPFPQSKEKYTKSAREVEIAEEQMKEIEGISRKKSDYEKVRNATTTLFSLSPHFYYY